MELARFGGEVKTTSVTHSVTLGTSKSRDVNSDLVKVRINYPAGWSGYKFFKDGEIKSMAKETADQFIAQGIAAIEHEPHVENASDLVIDEIPKINPDVNINSQYRGKKK